MHYSVLNNFCFVVLTNFWMQLSQHLLHVFSILVKIYNAAVDVLYFGFLDFFSQCHRRRA